MVRAASIWKVALLVEAFRQRAAGNLSFDTLLEMNADVLERVDPPASLVPGQHITVGAALQRAMTISDNTTAVLLGDRLGYATMTHTLTGLGLQSTDVNTRQPVTTARDTALLLEVAVGARPASWTRPLADVVEMRNLLLGETRNQRIPARLPAGTAVAHKTGDLAGISNDAGIIYASTGPLTLSILARDVPGHGRAEATAAEIAAMVFEVYDPQTVQSSSPAG